MAKIYFYDGSDINGLPLVTDNPTLLYSYLHDNGIVITEQNKMFVSKTPIVHAIYKQDEDKVIMSGDYESLKKAFLKRQKKKEKTIDDETEITEK